MHRMPTARGDASAALIENLSGEPRELDGLPVPVSDDPLADEDLQLALYLCYELHYRGLPDVDDRWEWNPSLLRWRAELEALFEFGLRAAVPRPDGEVVVERELRDLARAGGPSLSAYVRTRATLDQVREFLIHRSAYQLKEADPHSWAIPRLAGAPKAALIEVQADEYGGGRVEWMHAELFARTLRAVGLDDTYGAYVDHLPAVTLATVNVMSMFGLHRRWRGAIVGHLALFEMTSSLPNRRYGDALRRLGFDRDATLFFDEHVTADAIHENIASVDLAGGLARQAPELAADVVWGARALDQLEKRWGHTLLRAWRSGETALRGGREAVSPRVLARF